MSASVVAHAIGLGAWAVTIAWGVRRAALLRRGPLLVAALAVGGALALSLLGLLPSDPVGRWVRVDRPWFLLGSLAVVMALVVRLLRLAPARRQQLVDALVSVSALCAALAAAGVQWVQPVDRLAVIVLADRSRSIDLVPGAETRISKELQVAELSMRRDDAVGLVAFAAGAAVEDPPRPRTALPPSGRPELARDGTDIAAGIRRALGEVPADAAARIALLSDGVATRGDTLQAAAAALAGGVPIDVVPLEQAAGPNLRVHALRVSPSASENEPLELKLATYAARGARVEVRLFLDGELVRRAEGEVRAGEDLLRLTHPAPAAGLHRFRVEISALSEGVDTSPEDNSASAFVRVQGPPSALILEGERAQAAPLESALRAGGFEVETGDAVRLASDIAGFARFDLVVLSDIAAAEFSPEQIEALASYVRDLGGGLLLMGGDRSLGPGGFGKTPIEDVSPVSFDLKQERRRASLAEVIAIDYSGSMSMQVGGKTKLELANEAAARSAELLGSGDRLGVMHVDTSVRWTLPLAPITDPQAVKDQIRAVQPGGGGIYVDLTLTQAYEALAKEQVNLRHLLLFADGSDAEERRDALRLVASARAKGITTSVVALGRGNDVPALEQLSRAGDGRFYLIEDATRLPAVFAQETILASRSALREEPFRATPGSPGPAVRGVDVAALPGLEGYVVSIAKPRSQVYLHALDGDPLLAVWSAGIGKAAAFTSDYKARWGSAWTSAPSAARLFVQVAREIVRRRDDRRVSLQAETDASGLHVQASVIGDDGSAESFRRLYARVVGPSGQAERIPLEARAPGSYAATLPLSRPGAYLVSAIDEAGDELLGTTGAVLEAGQELRPTGTDRTLLRQIAAMTGGKERDTLAGIFDDRPSRNAAFVPLGRALLLAAALALLFGVAARRLVLPEGLTAAPARLRAALSPRARASAGPPQPRTLSHLLQRQQRHKAPRAQARARDRAAPPPSPTQPAAAPPPAAAPHPPGTQPDRPAPSPSPSPTQAAPPAPPDRPRSAAEILLERRRSRRG